jgi:hypothetical protein
METFSEIQIGRHFSDTFPKGLQEGVITLSPLLFSSVLVWNMSLRDPSKPGGIDGTWQLLVYTVFIYCAKTWCTVRKTGVYVSSGEVGLELNAEKIMYMFIYYQHHVGQVA